MQITLRGKTYQAEHLTDLNTLPLMAIARDAKGQPVQSLEEVTAKLVDPKMKSAIAQAVSAMFPSIPKDLVFYSHETFNLNLTLNELLQIVTACNVALGGNAGASGAIAPVATETLTPEEAIALAKAEILRGEGLVAAGEAIAPTMSGSPGDGKWARLAQIRKSLDELESEYAGLQAELQV